MKKDVREMTDLEMRVEIATLRGFVWKQTTSGTLRLIPPYDLFAERWLDVGEPEILLDEYVEYSTPNWPQHPDAAVGELVPQFPTFVARRYAECDWQVTARLCPLGRRGAMHIVARDDVPTCDCIGENGTSLSQAICRAWLQLMRRTSGNAVEGESR